MKRGFKAQACGLEQILLFAVLIVAGLLPAVRSVWGEDKTASPSQPPLSLAAAPRADGDVAFDVDQIHAQLRFLSVPTELVESTISDWTLAPFDQAQLAAADPFGTMNQPLRPQTKSRSTLHGQVTAGTEMRIPSTHKILNSREAELLLSRLEEDERTKSIFSPQLAFVDGITATAVVGEKTPFVVGWNNDFPQTRVVPKGKMVRLRTVLDDDKMWLDYEIIVSRILDVTTRSIRVANRPHPVKLAVPNVQTTKASATIQLPVGGTVLIGGLPAESEDGIPRQLLVLLRADRMRGFQSKKTAKSNPPKLQRKVGVDLLESPSASQRPAAEQKKRNPFSLISRILNRAPKQTADPVDVPARGGGQ
ncbi:MAG: hypothetical protein QF918_15490 [Pirellulaceae bacterium]|jgi:hypothetical protein|nr:hypothetical protein [Pirellulaceae bacterium]MDP6557251.1 hypothetical protein [Pirellulaceae bacterium]